MPNWITKSDCTCIHNDIQYALANRNLWVNFIKYKFTIVSVSFLTDFEKPIAFGQHFNFNKYWFECSTGWKRKKNCLNQRLWKFEKLLKFDFKIHQNKRIALLCLWKMISHKNSILFGALHWITTSFKLFTISVIQFFLVKGMIFNDSCLAKLRTNCWYVGRWKSLESK